MDDASAFGGVTDNPARARYELVENGLTAFADYRRHGEVVVLPHVEAPPALRSTGTAGRLMAGVLERIRAEGLKARPLCSYAVAYMRRNPQYSDLLA